MTTKELAVLLKVPKDRIKSFKVMLSNMKYKSNVLVYGIDYERLGGTIDYKEPCLDKVRTKIKIFKRPKRVYILDGLHRRVK